MEQLRNARYPLVFQDSQPVVQLTEGRYETGDSSSSGRMLITLADPIAFGDLDGDGAVDAAVLLAENYGGTGVFVSVIAVLNRDGQPVPAAAGRIDDRPMLNDLQIRNGQIFLEAVVHGPGDPSCCAARPIQEVLQYWGGKLVITGLSMRTPDGRERVIAIDSPAGGSAVSWPLTVAGHCTIAPFENNLVYSVYDLDNNRLALGPLTVNAAGVGGPGTFSLALDLHNTDLTGPIRIQVEDSSAADGSMLALASVILNIK
jgi:hypothetical protein